MAAHWTAPPRGHATADPAAGVQLDHAMQDFKQMDTQGLAADGEIVAARTRQRTLETQLALAASRPASLSEQIRGLRHSIGLVLQRLEMIHEDVVVTRENCIAGREMIEKMEDMGATEWANRVALVYGTDAVAYLAGRYNLDQQAKHETLAYAAANSTDRTEPDFPLVPFVKVSSTPVGNGIIPRKARRPYLPVVAIGDAIPSPPFPATRDAIERMTKQEINDLSIVMDNEFRIQPTDPLWVWRGRLRLFLTNYP